MHDPLVVAFDIPRPWPKVRRGKAPAARERRFALRYQWAKWYKPWDGWTRFWQVGPWVLYWPGLVTVWHVEPEGRDSGEVCKHMRRWQDTDGQWHGKPLNGWKFHVHHWRIQVQPLQHLRRTLLTRCQWCGGRQRKGDAVNISHQWDSDPTPWWRGESGLYHHDCSAIATAHRICLCAEGEGIWEHELSDYPYGQCLVCGKHRGWKSDDRRNSPSDEANRILASIPEGQRDPVKSAQVRAMWKAHREETSA